MKIDTQLGGLEGAAEHARRLEALGVDGAFTFEGPHDVFTPLVLAAAAPPPLELTTNVAIAFPRNPVQLAHQAYDLQLLSRDDSPLASAPRSGPRWRSATAPPSTAPSPGCASWSTLSGPSSPRGRAASRSTSGPVHLPHADASPVQPGSPPVRDAAHRHWRTRPPDGATGRRSGRRAAGHAVQHRRALPGANPQPAIDEGLGRAGRPRSALDRDRRGHRVLRSPRGRAGAARTAGRWLLSFYASTPAYRPVLEVEGWAELQPELNRLSKIGPLGGDGHSDRRHHAHTLRRWASPKRWPRRPSMPASAGQVDRVGFYTPSAVAEETLGELVE